MKNCPACNELKKNVTKKLQDHFPIIHSKKSMVTRYVIKQRYGNHSLKVYYNLHNFLKVYIASDKKIFVFIF